MCFTLGNPVADLDCALDATGVYTILAGSYYGEHPGTFNLFIQRLDNPADLNPIAFGQTLSDTVTIAPELPAFTFEAVAGDRVRVRMLDTSNTEFHPAIWVYRPDGTQVCFTLGNPVADLDCALDATGGYTILAGSYYWGTPRHTQPLRPAPRQPRRPQSDCLRADPFGRCHHRARAARLHLRESVAGDHVRVRVPTPEIPSSTLPSGSTARTEHRCASRSATPSPTLTAPWTPLASTPSWQVLITGNTPVLSIFTSRISTAPGLPIPILYNQPLTNTISMPLEWHTYQFDGERNGVPSSIRVVRLTEGSTRSIAVHRPDGSLLCESTSTETQNTLVCTLDSPATFTILVGDTGGSIGSYQLAVNRFLMLIPMIVK